MLAFGNLGPTPTKGESVVGRTKDIVIIIVVVFLLVAFFGVGIFTATSTSVNKEATENQYWLRENEVHIFCDIEIYHQQENLETYEIEYNPGKDDVEKFTSLNERIGQFFEEVYNIDVSEKLQNMEVNYFVAPMEEEFTAGYTPRGSKGIGLNVILFENANYSIFLTSTYVHEVMHYLGVTSVVDSAIDEGMADILASKFAAFASITYFPTEAYEYYRMVANQLCAVNEMEIVSGYIEDPNFDISEHISERLKDVPQVFYQVDNIGEVFSDLVGNLGKSFDDTGYYLAIISQDILSAYCRTFTPTDEQIGIIRQNYFVEDVENMTIIETDEGYEIVFQ